MKKNTYFFSHDYNAHDDVKILFMRQQLGMEGYGIYWYLVESLADAGGRLPFKIVPVLAMQMQTTEVKVQAVIKEFELFEFDDTGFFSIRLLKSIENLNNIKAINSEKGKKSGIARKKIFNGESTSENLTAVEPQLNRSSTESEPQLNKGKERKGNEKKESNKESPLLNSNLFRQPNIPTKEAVLQFFLGAGGTKEMAKSFYEKYDAVGWFANNSPIVNYTHLANRFITNWKSIEEGKKQRTNDIDPTKVKIVLK